MQVQTQMSFVSDTGPVISPPGFNASENATGKVVFRCTFMPPTAHLLWRTMINGTVLKSNLLEELGISWNETMSNKKETYIEISIRPTAENDRTFLECHVNISNTLLRSSIVEFRVQGK